MTVCTVPVDSTLSAIEGVRCDRVREKAFCSRVLRFLGIILLFDDVSQLAPSACRRFQMMMMMMMMILIPVPSF
jgi:hypothetical protein